MATWKQENCYPSEAQFIPKPASSLGETKLMDEDEGVLMSVVLDSAQSTSFLLVLDAKNLEELARIQLDKLIPLSFARGCHNARK
jgi:carotenoid cleavage dioxygenase-like enzyme